MQQRLWPREPTIFTDCPCMSSHIQERTHRIPLNLGVTISWAQKWWQDKWPNFNFKIFVYAPELHFLTFPLDYFQDHFSNKQGIMSFSPPHPQPPTHTHTFKKCYSGGGLTVLCWNTCSHKISHPFSPPYTTGERWPGAFSVVQGWVSVRGKQWRT